MKYLHLFDTTQDFENAESSLETPFVAVVKEEMENGESGLHKMDYVPPVPVPTYDHSALDGGTYDRLFDGDEFTFYATFDSVGTDQDGWIEPFVSTSNDENPEAFAAWDANLLNNVYGGTSLIPWLQGNFIFSRGSARIYVYGDDDLEHPLNDGTFYVEDTENGMNLRLYVYLNNGGDFYIAAGENYVECSNPSDTIHKYTIKVIIDSLYFDSLPMFGETYNGYYYEHNQRQVPWADLIPSDGALSYYGYKDGKELWVYAGDFFYNAFFFETLYNNTFILEAEKYVNGQWVSVPVSIGTESEIDGNQIEQVDDNYYMSFSINGEYKIGWRGGYYPYYFECPQGALYRLLLKLNPDYNLDEESPAE